MQSASEFFAWEGEPIVPIIKDRILPTRIIGVIWGEQATFKSFLALDLAFSVSTGTDWLVFNTNLHTTLIINTELPAELYQERFQQMAFNKKTLPDNLYIINDLALKIDTQHGLSRLVTWCEQIKPGLIIVDNLYRATTDLNHPNSMNTLLDNVSIIRQKYNVTFLFIHHAKKREYDRTGKVIDKGLEDMTGAKYLANNCAMIAEIKRFPATNLSGDLIGGSNEIQLEFQKLWFERYEWPKLRFYVNDRAEFSLKGI